MIKVISIFGTRPEAVKMAPIVQALALDVEMDSKVLITAQHRQMLDQVLEVFNIQPDIDLNLMRPDQSLAQITADIFSTLDPILKQEKPDWVLVQGDTTTVMAAAVLSYYNQIHVGHVEAGLRTHDKWQPFPEEINRRIAGVTADLHFAPTQHARQNLLHEGVEDERIVVTGNPVIDALQQIIRRPCPAMVEDLLHEKGIDLVHKRLVMVTAHRRENFGKPLEEICTALRSMAETNAGKIHIIYPVHLNPNVQEPVYRLLGNVKEITLLPPLDYLPLVHLLSRSTLVLTDSGGIQEEATALRVPTLVLRRTTERPEGVQAGILKLTGTDPAIILSEARLLLDDPAAHRAMARAANPFGDGHAAERIVSALKHFREPVGTGR
jgi:UDP-N-acetylglucosamine 2-epimerase (non-hydrolysing)